MPLSPQKVTYFLQKTSYISARKCKQGTNLLQQAIYFTTRKSQKISNFSARKSQKETNLLQKWSDFSTRNSQKMALIYIENQVISVPETPENGTNLLWK